jgi:Domain of unknown function (DUF4232)
MKNVKLIIILLVIITFCIAGYYFLQIFSRPQNVSKYPAPPFIKLSPTLPPTVTPTNAISNQTQITACTQNELRATIMAQGAAGNIYGTLEMANTGKAACSVELGNTVSAMTDAKNITIHYQQTAPSQTFILAPGSKVYSQVHYPNGPQCQSGIAPKPISFLYKTLQTAITFQSTTPHEGTLMIQACTSLAEKTVVDIWPLSLSPITP